MNPMLRKSSAPPEPCCQQRITVLGLLSVVVMVEILAVAVHRPRKGLTMIPGDGAMPTMVGEVTIDSMEESGIVKATATVVPDRGGNETAANDKGTDRRGIETVDRGHGIATEDAALVHPCRPVQGTSGPRP